MRCGITVHISRPDPTRRSVPTIMRATFGVRRARPLAAGVRSAGAPACRGARAHLRFAACWRSPAAPESPTTDDRPDGAPSLACRQVVPPDAIVRWVEPEGRRDRDSLARWCDTIGPVLLQPLASQAAVPRERPACRHDVERPRRQWERGRRRAAASQRRVHRRRTDRTFRPAAPGGRTVATPPCRRRSPAAFRRPTVLPRASAAVPTSGTWRRTWASRFSMCPRCATGSRRSIPRTAAMRFCRPSTCAIRSSSSCRWRTSAARPCSPRCRRRRATDRHGRFAWRTCTSTRRWRSPGADRSRRAGARPTRSSMRSAPGRMSPRSWPAISTPGGAPPSRR